MMLGPAVRPSTMELLRLALKFPAMSMCERAGASIAITQVSLVASMNVDAPLPVHGWYSKMYNTSLLPSLVAIALAHLLALVQSAPTQVARLNAIAGGGHVELMVSCMRCHSLRVVPARYRGTPGPPALVVAQLPLLPVLLGVHVLVELARCCSTNSPSPPPLLRASPLEAALLSVVATLAHVLGGLLALHPPLVTRTVGRR